MTDQSNAAQAADQNHIEALRDLQLGVQMDRLNLDDGQAKLDALAAAIDALSKLRPEGVQAGDERVALAWYAQQVADCRKMGADGDAARQALDKDGGQRARAALASAPVVPQPCPTDVCQAAKADGVLCANDECDRASGVRPASAPVAVPDGWRLVPIDPTEEMRQAGAQYAECGISANAVFGYRAMLAAAPGESAPVAGEAQEPVGEVFRHGEGRDENGPRVGIRMLPAAAGLPHGTRVYAAPQASEAVPAGIIEYIAQQWDGCEYDGGPCGMIDIGEAIRRAALKTKADKDGAVCSCPTGDGSLRHPCAVHPDCAKGAGEAKRIMRFNIHGTLINPHPNGMYVRYEDHCVALAAQKQGDSDGNQ